MVLQVKAVAVAARAFPEMNAFVRDGVVETATSVHVGLAIALRGGGLVAPAVHDAADKDLDRLATEITDLVHRVRAGRMRSSEMSDPTLTVTSLGDEGVDTVLGVIYPPQVALVGFGRPQDRPRVVGGAITVAPSVTIGLSADHRVSDGRRGAQFLLEIARLLGDPDLLREPPR